MLRLDALQLFQGFLEQVESPVRAADVFLEPGIIADSLGEVIPFILQDLFRLLEFAKTAISIFTPRFPAK